MGTVWFMSVLGGGLGVGGGGGDACGGGVRGQKGRSVAIVHLCVFVANPPACAMKPQSSVKKCY